MNPHEKQFMRNMVDLLRNYRDEWKKEHNEEPTVDNLVTELLEKIVKDNEQ